MTERVTYRSEAGVAYITMDDGKVNVMSTAMLGDLNAALDRAEQDQAIVVLRSARPGIFSAGFDLKVFAANDPVRSLEMVKAGAELALRLMSHPSPTVGVMEGHAFPMGAFLLLGCDVRIGALGKFRMGLNEVAIGIVPPGFAIELARSRLHPAWLNRIFPKIKKTLQFLRRNLKVRAKFMVIYAAECLVIDQLLYRWIWAAQLTFRVLP